MSGIRVKSMLIEGKISDDESKSNSDYGVRLDTSHECELNGEPQFGHE